MSDEIVRNLQLLISTTRAEAYRPVGASDLSMLTNYIWNVELSESLYPSLQAFEVGLRNRIHTAFSQNWQSPVWFDRGVLAERQVETVQIARQQLTNLGKPHEPDRIVAELSFGFWTSLLNSPYEEIWHSDGARLLDGVFPNLPRWQRNRKRVSQRINRILRLRNRVFHHEPIWNRTDLAERHAEITEALFWLSADMRDVLTLYDRFDHAFSDRDVISQKLAQHLG